MTKSLKISDDLSLPLDAATRRLAILAMSGAGKSNVAVVMAEAMYDAGIPWIAIDPKGDWFGVRSGADGKGPGLPIPIFGGLHGDIPLEPNAGAYIGNLIVDQRLTCILDVSEFSDRQRMWGFLADLGETLLHRNRSVLHVYLEEADEYLPQSTKEKGNLPRCLGVWQRVVKRGRFRGLGTTQISQRSATLNKDTLYQAECLIALRATGKGDRKAIAGWVEHHNAGEEMVASLPLLDDGEGWVSSPAWLKITKRTHFARRRTFDSGATPILSGKKQAPPATLADVDIEVIRKEMTATIERAKENDPKELKKTIADLRKQLSAKSPATPSDADLSRAKAEGKRESDAAWKTTTAALETARHEDRSRFERLRRLLARVAPMFADIAKELSVELPAIPEMPKDVAQAPVMRRSETSAPRSVTVVARNGNGSADDLPRAQQKIIDTLAMLESVGITQPSKTQLALWCDVSPSSGAYFNNLGALRSAGFISYPSSGDAMLTDSGRSRANAVTPPTAEEMQASLCAKVGAAKAAIVRFLIGIYPDSIAKDELAERIGVSPTSGAYFNNLGALRTLGVIDYPSVGRAVAKPVLFLER